MTSLLTRTLELFDSTGTPVEPLQEEFARGIDWYMQPGTSPLECWYGAGVANCNALTTGAPAVGTLIALPFVSGRGGTLDRIAFNVTTVGGAGSKARVGIYTNQSDGVLYPQTLLDDGGEFLCDAATGVKSTTIARVLSAGQLYWFAYLCGTAAPTIRCLSVAGTWPIFGLDNTLGTTPTMGLTVATAYGALPATFTAAATRLTAVPIPAIFARFSS